MDSLGHAHSPGEGIPVGESPCSHGGSGRTEGAFPKWHTGDPYRDTLRGSVCRGRVASAGSFVVGSGWALDCEAVASGRRRQSPGTIRYTVLFEFEKHAAFADDARRYVLPHCARAVTRR